MKVLDENGVKHLWNKISLDDYPNNEVLMAVLNAIDAEIKDIKNNLYPVGSIYFSTTEVNPEEIIGGKWQKIEDKFLLTSGPQFNLGETGGEIEHTLTVDEIPGHNHSIDRPQWFSAEDGAATGDKAYGSTWLTTNEYSDSTSIQSTGGNQPHNNMPPYIVVHAWTRIE